MLRECLEETPAVGQAFLRLHARAHDIAVKKLQTPGATWASTGQPALSCASGLGPIAGPGTPLIVHNFPDFQGSMYLAIASTVHAVKNASVSCRPHFSPVRPTGRYGQDAEVVTDPIGEVSGQPLSLAERLSGLGPFTYTFRFTQQGPGIRTDAEQDWSPGAVRERLGWTFDTTDPGIGVLSFSGPDAQGRYTAEVVSLTSSPDALAMTLTATGLGYVELLEDGRVPKVPKKALTVAALGAGTLIIAFLLGRQVAHIASERDNFLEIGV